MANAKSTIPRAAKRRLTKVAVRAFRSHWRTILRLLRHNPRSLARKRYTAFEADTVAKQRSLAREFYCVAHAEEMVRLSEAEVRDWLMGAYLPAAIQFCLDESIFDDVREQEKFMRSLVKAEYVIVDDVKDYANFGSADPDWSDCSVGPYPTPLYYDDWFSRTGEDCYPFLSVMYKSTSEPFSKDEMEWIASSVVRNIEAYSGSGAPWHCSTDADGYALYISACEEDSEPRIDATKAEIQELPRSQLVHIFREADLILTKRCLPRIRVGKRDRDNDQRQERIPVLASPMARRGNRLAKYLSRPISRASKAEILKALFKALRWKQLDWHEIKGLEQELARVHGRAKRRSVDSSA